MGLVDKCRLPRVFSLGRMVVAVPSDRKLRNRRVPQPMVRAGNHLVGRLKKESHRQKRAD